MRVNACEYPDIEDTTIINGTTFVICRLRDATQFNDFQIAGMVSIMILVIITAIVSYCSCKRRFENERMRLKNTSELQAINVNKLRRWETFITHSGYIRRIAQVLEAEEHIPQEVEEYVEEFDPVTYQKMKNTTDFKERAILVITYLFNQEADVVQAPVLEVIKKWRNELVDKCGGEWAEQIMDRVEEFAFKGA